MTDALPEAVRDAVGDDFDDAEPARVIAELAIRYADPAEVALHLDAAQRAEQGRFSPDDTVDEIIRDILTRAEESVGLQTVQASVRRVAGVRQPKTVKGYVRDAMRDGPFRPHPSSLSRWIVDVDHHTTAAQDDA